MEFLEVLEVFGENINDGSCFCESFWIGIISLSGKLFKGVWSVLAGKLIGLILDIIVIVSVVNFDIDSSDDNAWDEYSRNVPTMIYIFYQRGSAILIMLSFMSFLPKRRNEILKRDENYLINAINNNDNNNNNNNNNTDDKGNNDNGNNDFELTVKTEDGKDINTKTEIITRTEEPVEIVETEGQVEKVSGQSGLTNNSKPNVTTTAEEQVSHQSGQTTTGNNNLSDKQDNNNNNSKDGLSLSDKILIENNLYIGSHFVGIDLCGKIVSKKVSDGDFSKRDGYYCCGYGILIVIDLILWSIVAAMLSAYYDGSSGQFIALFNVVIGGFFGHLQHYIIIFVSPIKNSDLKEKWCINPKCVFYPLFFILISYQILICFCAIAWRGDVDSDDSS